MICFETDEASGFLPRLVLFGKGRKAKKEARPGNAPGRLPMGKSWCRKLGSGCSLHLAMQRAIASLTPHERVDSPSLRIFFQKLGEISNAVKPICCENVKSSSVQVQCHKDVN